MLSGRLEIQFCYFWRNGRGIPNKLNNAWKSGTYLVRKKIWYIKLNCIVTM